MSYRIRPRALFARATARLPENELPPTAAAIARDLGLHVNTVRAMLRGRPVSMPTFDRVLAKYGDPNRPSDLFEPIPDDEQPAPRPRRKPGRPRLRAVEDRAAGQRR